MVNFIMLISYRLSITAYVVVRVLVPGIHYSATYFNCIIALEELQYCKFIKGRTICTALICEIFMHIHSTHEPLF